MDFCLATPEAARSVAPCSSRYEQGWIVPAVHRYVSREETLQQRRIPAFPSATDYFTHGRHIQKLLEIAKSCAHANWDDREAPSIAPETVASAMVFLSALPSHMSPSEIYAGRDGMITFEWYDNPRNLVSIFVGEGLDVEFAALYGNRSECGQAGPIGPRLDDRLSSLILRAVNV